MFKIIAFHPNVLYSVPDMDNQWEKPEITILGDVEKLVKSTDVDGSGDTQFPINLASPGE